MACLNDKDPVVIFAGYPQQEHMPRFIRDANP